MAVHFLRLGLIVAALGSMLGCATTPQPVKVSANFTAGMIGQLQRELGNFESVQQTTDASMVKFVGALDLTVEEQRLSLNQELRTRSATGDAQGVQFFNNVRGLADGLHEDDQELATAQTNVDKHVATLLKPLSDPSSKLASAAVALALLGQDVSSKTQFDETFSTLQDVWTKTADNRKKLSTAIGAGSAK